MPESQDPTFTPDFEMAEQLHQESFMARARNIGHNVLSSINETFHDVADRFSTKVAVGALATTAVAALAPGIAEAKIVVGKGIGPVQLGQTKAQVTHELGKPGKVINTAGHGQASHWYYMRKSLGLKVPKEEVYFNGPGQVDEVIIWDSSQKTGKGVGVGSSKAAVKRAYPGFKALSHSFIQTSTAANGDKVYTGFGIGPGNKVASVSILDWTASTIS